jgi:hypothetical protein
LFIINHQQASVLRRKRPILIEAAFFFQQKRSLSELEADSFYPRKLRIPMAQT